MKKLAAIAALLALLGAFLLASEPGYGHGKRGKAMEAVWYRAKGQRGACGKVLGYASKKTGRYAAHKTLPCGTKLTVHYRGRHVRVRVLDRGPYGGADIDLCRWCFKRIAPLSRGRIQVRVTRGW